MSFLKKLQPVLVAIGYWLLAKPVLAIDTGLGTTASTAGFNTARTDLAAKIGEIVGIALSFVGIVFLILMIYGGFTWMTARGEAEKVKKAKDVIINSVIGLIIVFAAYAITFFVMQNIGTATGINTTS